MASLPPYSTYRTDSKQLMYPQATSHGNVLTFTPPGFKHSLNVKFPDSRLPVCEKCKRNFKTRDMCRVRNAHTTAPWTTAFMCLTLDESCTDENGKYIDKPLIVRMVQWQPYCVKEPFDPKTPVCAACKKTNRTRSFCRERHKHRQLPWCTVYVLLSALSGAEAHTIVAQPSKLVDGEEGASKEADSKPPAVAVAAKAEEEQASTPKAEDDKENPAAPPAASFDSEHTTLPASDGDDINQIASSRTFLAKVSGSSTTIHWLELAEYDVNDAGAAFGIPISRDGQAAPPPPMNPASGPDRYAQRYAAQQHQDALKSHQQYYFQMQQRGQQPYAPWPHHYSPQAMQMPGQAPPPPPPGVAAPYTPIPPQIPQAQQAAGDSTASPPVTAGEAAAQRRRNQQTAQAAGPSDPAAQQQQWAAMYHPQMMYSGQPGAPHPHMAYAPPAQHQQGHPAPGSPPQDAEQAQAPQYTHAPEHHHHHNQEQPPGHQAHPPSQQHLQEPEGCIETNHGESDAKRQRLS